MSEPEFGLITIGNALVDAIQTIEESFLSEQKIEKGSMTLIDAERAAALYNGMPSPLEMSGGSASNTMACFASFGGKGAAIGKVANDKLGKTYAASFNDMGVTFTTPPLEGDTPTGRCLSFVTPDGERSMATYLGAGVELSPKDIDPDFIAKAEVTYLEGYLFDPPQAMEAYIKASRAAHEAGRRVSLTLSDSFCVDRHREAFKDLVDHHVDILFANEDEIKSLYETDDLEEAIKIVSGKVAICAITCGKRGSIILNAGHRTDVAAEPDVTVIDSTGAGDAYAAGFLYGFIEKMNMEQCGRLGSIAAAEVIAQMGPRPAVSLAELMQQKAA